MSKKQKRKPALATIKAKISKIKKMSWDSWSNIMLIVTGAVATITFVSVLATLYIGYMSGKEKDAKAKAQDERIAELDLKRVEAERDLLELQKGLAPRKLGDSTALANVLRNFAGTKVKLAYFKELECEQTARQIEKILENAGWNVSLTWTPNIHLPNNGIDIQYNNDDKATMNAGIALFEQLFSRDLDVEIGVASQNDMTVPYGTLGIVVALRPLAHIPSDEERDQRDRKRKDLQRAVEQLKKKAKST